MDKLETWDDTKSDDPQVHPRVVQSKPGHAATFAEAEAAFVPPAEVSVV